MLSSQRKKLQLKHYDALHMLVEKFTIHNLSAPHKYGIWDSKENYAYGTWAHIPQPRNALILGEEKTPYLSTLIIAINEGGKPCVWGKVKVLPNFFYGTKLVPPKALGKKCSSWHYSVKSTGHSSLWRYPLIRMFLHNQCTNNDCWCTLWDKQYTEHEIGMKQQPTYWRGGPIFTLHSQLRSITLVATKEHVILQNFAMST